MHTTIPTRRFENTRSIWKWYQTAPPTRKIYLCSPTQQSHNACQTSSIYEKIQTAWLSPGRGMIKASTHPLVQSRDKQGNPQTESSPPTPRANDHNYPSTQTQYTIDLQTHSTENTASLIQPKHNSWFTLAGRQLQLKNQFHSTSKVDKKIHRAAFQSSATNTSTVDIKHELKNTHGCFKILPIISIYQNLAHRRLHLPSWHRKVQVVELNISRLGDEWNSAVHTSWRFSQIIPWLCKNYFPYILYVGRCILSIEPFFETPH